jgi:adenosine deaminase
MFFDPQTHTARGVGFDVFMEGFDRAMRRAEELGMSTALIMCFLRHLGPEKAMDTWHEALPYRERILGVGLDSSERGFPPEPFSAVYRAAAEAGLRLVAHAGEEGPSSHIIGSLDVLGCERIDHGVRAEEDDALVDRLVAEQIPLTMCPLSNRALRVIDTLADHNLKRLLDRGVRVTVNSDDPSYFGGYIGDNYLAVAQALDLSNDDLAQLARNSIEASFADRSDKTRWLASIDGMAL